MLNASNHVPEISHTGHNACDRFATARYYVITSFGRPSSSSLSVRSPVYPLAHLVFALMPGVVLLHPTSPGPGLGSSHNDKSHFHLTDNTRNGHNPPPAMHNGSVSTINDLTVAEIKEKAKEDVRRAAKGVSALSLIKSARNQSQQARVYESQGDLKAALSAFLKAGLLTHMFITSPEVSAENKPGRHGVLYKEFLDFEKVDLHLVRVVCG